jgi:murein DD-endopeptidase MepM/ murein hydrolase activator NlpD
MVFALSASASYALVSHVETSGVIGRPRPELSSAAEPRMPGTDVPFARVEPGPGASPAIPRPAAVASQETSVVQVAEPPLAPTNLLPALALEPASPVPLVPRDEASEHVRVVTGHVPVGGTVASSLRGQGISDALIHEIAVALEPAFDFRNARAGDLYALITDGRQELLSFEFRRGRSDVYRLERRPGGALEPQVDGASLERRVVQLGGVVRSSLFEALGELGEGAEIAQRFADVFAWDFDFSRQTRPGDEFRMVFEKYYDRDGFVRYGKMLAARYATAGRREMTALYFEDDGGPGDYYTPDGKCVRRSFLRAPLTYTRISSGYSRSRLHPVLKIRRPHEGIDYAAPTGTPVWAVADGTVSFVGWKGGYGRLIQVRHDNGYVSFYGHLSRYAQGLRVGRRVRQQDVIGFVGSSGLATGPHLDYRLQLKGRFVDPLRVTFAQGRPIAPASRERFERVAESRLAELNEAVPAFVLEAAM